MAPQPTAFGNGRYQVKRFLGEGGKKRVYLAHDTTLGRDVAFALIKTEGLDEVGRERIRREAQAMGRMGTHPHVVSVFDLGDEQGQPYMVTELMAGGDVEGLIEKAPNHRVPLERALRIADEVCRGLEFAHEQLLVHRDLKPGNVWLTADGTAKLGDFGLAVATDRSRLTQAGLMVGTVSYMPPEQAIGGEVSPRSDLYSLGAMLYELVTGRPPFLGDEAVTIITQHLNVPPVAPSWHNPDLPPALETLILRLLEKDASRRPLSAREVRAALAAVMSTRASGTTPTASGAGDGSADPGNAAASGRSDAGGPAIVNPIYRRTFVGREAELKQLQAAFDAALSGQGALLMVVGEPGIGKTALCEQLATYAAMRGGKTLVGHSYEEGSLSLAYLPFVEALRSYVLARDPAALKADLGSGAADVARIISEVRDRVNVEPRPAGPDADEDRWRLYQAVASFLTNASRVQPLLVILEDLHWADRGTLDLLVFVARHLEGARLLIVGNYRDVEVDRAHPLSSVLAELRRGASFARVPLRGLTPDEVQRMITTVSGQEVRWAVAEAVHRQTEGNPLFVQEVLRYLVEEGVVTREQGHWQPTGGTPLELQIPEGLRDVIGKRLSRLSVDCNRVLTVAAVIGREFDLGVLRRVVELDEDPLVDALEEALRVGVIEEQTGGRGALRYRFAHAFFRQTLYEELSGPRRLRWHQQVARALEAHYTNRLDEHAAEMAEHFAQATDPDGLSKAITYSRLAAERALGVYAYGDAARLFAQAVEVQEILAPEDKAARCDLLLALGAALIPTGDPVRVYEAVAEQAFQLAEQSGDGSRASRVCELAIAALHQAGAPFWGGMGAYVPWAERADRFAEPGSRARVIADIALSSVQNIDGDRMGEWRMISRAFDLAKRLGDSQLVYEAGQRRLRATWLPHDWPEQRSIAAESGTWPRQGVSIRPLGLVLRRSAQIALIAGERATTELRWSELAELAGRTRDAEASLWAIQIEGLRATLDGRLEEALGAADRLLARVAELQSGFRGPAEHNFMTAFPLIWLGRAEEALAAFGTIDRDDGIRRSYRGMLQAHAARVADAQATVGMMLNVITGTPEQATAQELARGLEAAVLLGMADAARIFAKLLEDVPAVHNDFFVTNVSRHAGGAAALLGDRPAALAHYERSLAWATAIRFRPEIALTRLALAELLLTGSATEQAEALPHLDFAIDEFRAMQMQPSLERALRHKGLLHA